MISILDDIGTKSAYLNQGHMTSGDMSLAQSLTSIIKLSPYVRNSWI